MPNLKKKRKKEVVKEGEVVRQKKPKQQKTVKGQGRASLVENRKDQHAVEVLHQSPVWDPPLEMDGAAIP